ncbi:unnamed protein product, partial [Allacma fusca]
IVAPDLIYK